MVPYLELITRYGLAVKVDDGISRYKTTAKGEEALRHMKKLEELMPERGELSDEAILLEKHFEYDKI